MNRAFGVPSAENRQQGEVMGAIEDLIEIEEIKNLRNLYSHYYDG